MRKRMKSIEQYIEIINKGLSEIAYPAHPDELYAPVRYELSLGGKRIRPLLALLACEMFGADCRAALAPALGIEIFHNFTLLHDDVMDKAELRRGKPVVHKVWSENTAILSGDAMQILAYTQLLKTPDSCLREVLELFSRTAIEICEGQQFDMEFEERTDVSEEEYLNMIRLKTAVLLGCALQTGAVVARSGAEAAEKLYRFGVDIGLAFQLKDDYLDVYGDAAVFGKKIGGDILNNKKTYLLVNALKRAQGKDRDELLHWLSCTSPDAGEKIAAVTALYDRLGIRELCEQTMQSYYVSACECLDSVEVKDVECKKQLQQLAAGLMYREH